MRVFIDGEAGTTGLRIRDRIAEIPGAVAIPIDPDRRKNASARAECMAAADIVVLCLPDDAARAAVSMVEALPSAGRPRVLDASSAHRTADGWVYGLPEMSPEQPARIAGATKVSNPGCYATGAIAILRPLVAAGVLPPDHPVSINAISGYSGGGRAMIERHEAEGGPAFQAYALGLDHKHVPEITRHAGLRRPPIFVPSVGHFARGMLVSIPLHLDLLPGRPDIARLREVLEAAYDGSEAIAVAELPGDARLTADPQHEDRLQLFVAGRDGDDRAVLVARLDNLGKGAASAAIQNLRLMAGQAV